MKRGSIMGKKVLITGGTKGIGLAAVKRFVGEGYEVYVVARNFENFHAGGVKTVVADLTELENISKIKEETGDIDILINNAGMDIKKSYIEYQEEDIQKIVNLNLRAPIELIKLYAPKWIENGVGRVVNVASQAAEIGHTDIWYGITKAGLVNVTKSFASILAAKGVVINAVAPGPVDTDFLKDSAFAERFEALKKRVYTGRFATAEEVAEVIYWLAVDSPQYINGETIDINNGAQRIK